MKIRQWAVVVALVFPLYAQAKESLQQQVDSLSQQLEEVRAQLRSQQSADIPARVEELEEYTDSIDKYFTQDALVGSFESIKMDFGGFLHSAYTHVEGEAASASSFNRQNVELLVRADLSERWSIFFAGGYLRESDDPFEVGSITEPEFNSRNKNPNIVSWANYRHDDFFNVKIGRILTPHGIVNIEHFPAGLVDPEQPQFLRPFSGNTIFPNFVTGLQLHGRAAVNSSNYLSYAAYVGNFSGVPDEELGGIRLAANLWSNLLEVGVNSATNNRRLADGSNDGVSLNGVDIRVEAGRLSWKTEFFETRGEREGSRRAAYTQPAWTLAERWVVFAKLDYLDAGSVAGQENESTEAVLGVNYLPQSNIRMRLTYTDKTFKNANTATGNDVSADVFQASATFSF